jgi:hypothetical protein
MDITKLNIIYNNTKSNISDNTQEQREDSADTYSSSTQNYHPDAPQDGDGNPLFLSYFKNSEFTTTSTIEWLGTWRPLSD